MSSLIVVNERKPTAPRDVNCKVAEALSTAELGAFADLMAYFVGWRGRKESHWQISRLWDPTNGTPGWNLPKGNETFRLFHRIGLRANQIQLIVKYQAAEESTSKLEAWIEDLSGVSIDGDSTTPAFEWDALNNTLPLSDEDNPSSNLNFNVRYPPQVVDTSDLVIATPVTLRPRTFNVGSNQGDKAQIVLRATDLRVMSVTAIEMYEEFVTP